MGPYRIESYSTESSDANHESKLKEKFFRGLYDLLQLFLDILHCKISLQDDISRLTRNRKPNAPSRSAYSVRKRIIFSFAENRGNLPSLNAPGAFTCNFYYCPINKHGRENAESRDRPVFSEEQQLTRATTTFK